MSVSNVAMILGCSTTHVYRMIDAGLLDSQRINRRHFVIKESVDAYISKHTDANGVICISIPYALALRRHYTTDHAHIIARSYDDDKAYNDMESEKRRTN